MAKFHANGKLMLTGEYLVLQGARALALPLNLGQSLEVTTINDANGMIHWDAYTPKGFWFASIFSKHDFTVHASDDMDKADNLSKIFRAIKLLNPNILQDKNDYFFTTRLEFDKDWGLGSSSTLISLLAQWANVNPYELLKRTFGGSGYDIACATAEGPIYYQVKTKVPEPVEGPTPMVKPIDFQPYFANHLFFIYQGQKQSSSKEIKAFLEKANPVELQQDIDAVSEISRAVPKCESLDEFAMLMQCHERIIARCIGQEPVQKRFSDFEGVLKSLGAWGGDFILAATKWTENQVRAYFKEKGLDVVFGYMDLVL